MIFIIYKKQHYNLNVWWCFFVVIKFGGGDIHNFEKLANDKNENVIMYTLS